VNRQLHRAINSKGCTVITGDKLSMIFLIFFLDIEDWNFYDICISDRPENVNVNKTFLSLLKIGEKACQRNPCGIKM
jgi:restriction endonuclease S subunit